MVISGTNVRADDVLGGRYRLGAVLGRGGMADVYDAVDERLGRPVAVKVLRPEMAAQPDVRRRFEAEARAAARLHHPNAVAVFDTGIDGSVPWLVMERLPGETLADRMRRDGPLGAEWVRRMAGDVLGALVAAHAAGLVHRDIKPGNILIGDDGCAKLADFGIAKSLEVADDHTLTGQLIGTPAYLAPERIDGEPATVQADLYALGVVLYEALSGQRPFDGSTPMTIAYAVQHADVPPLPTVRPDLPPSLVDAVGRAMVRDPERRFATAADMARALHSGLSSSQPAAAAGDDAPTVVLSALVPESGQERTRNRVRVAAVALAAVLLAVLVIAGLLAVAGSQPSSAEVLAGDLREAADGLSAPMDGPRAGETAARLRDLAAKVQAGDGQAATATQAGDALLGDLANWRALGELAAPTADRLRRLVLRVPGTSAASFTATTTTAPPPPAASEENGDNERARKGNGKKKDDD